VLEQATAPTACRLDHRQRIGREEVVPRWRRQAAVGKTVYMANIPLTIVGVVERLTRPTTATANGMLR
jgi:hypothetical protein